MANRYRRFISATLDYAQLHEIADEFNKRGLTASVTWDEFIVHGATTREWFLEVKELPSLVSTQYNLHYFTTGQVQPLDRITDEVLVAMLEKYPDWRVTCSHCYSHTYDNSDVEGLWQPNPSESCMLSCVSASMKMEAS